MERKDILNETEAPSYARFKLKFNPFPMTAIASGGTPFPLYAPRAEETIKDFIVRTYDENNYGGMVIVGDFGYGKTHVLRWIEKTINEKYSQRNGQAACAIYVENPQTSPRELISSMVSHYGINKYLTMLWGLTTHAWRARYEREGEEFLNQFRPRQLELFDRDMILELLNEANIADPLRFVKRLSDQLGKTKRLDLERFSEFAYESVIAPIFGATEFANALKKFNPDGFNASFREWASLIEFKALRKNIYLGKTDREFLHSLLEVFKRSGFRRVYLLIDEFEDIHENIKKEKLVTYLRTLRDCIDGNQDRLALILALKPAVVDRIELTYGGFLKRFPISYWFELEGIMKEAIKDFISQILQQEVREEGYEDMGTLPFTEDGLFKIYDYTGPNPRLILQTCSDLLFKAAKAEKDLIDENFVQEFYTVGTPSIATIMDRVWVTKAVEAKIDEEFPGDKNDRH